MITPKPEKVLRVRNGVRKQQARRFNASAASINVIPKENIVRTRRIFAAIKEAEEVLVLTMDVTTDCDGRLELKQDGLIEIDLSDFLA
jgi:hypothetical protein